MGTAKITLRLGQRAEAATITAGTPIPGSDAMELNIDATRMRKGDALILLDKIEMVLFAKGFSDGSGFLNLLLSPVDGEILLSPIDGQQLVGIA